MCLNIKSKIDCPNMPCESNAFVLNARKPDFITCEQQMRRPASAHPQTVISAFVIQCLESTTVQLAATGDKDSTRPLVITSEILERTSNSSQSIRPVG